MMASEISISCKEKLLDTAAFAVERVSFSVRNERVVGSASSITTEHFRLLCRDCVTVLPIWNGHAVLIRQPRIGSESFVLETPGGRIDSGERDATMAAARELEEETGLLSNRILSLASLNPNPALMANRCHFFLALDCEPAVSRKRFPDSEEMIEPVLVPIHKLEEHVRHGIIDHALSALCIMLALKYLDPETKSQSLG